MRRVARHLDRYGTPLRPRSLDPELPAKPAYTPPAWNQCQHGADIPPRCTAIGTHRLTDEDIAYRRRRPELNFSDPATLRWCKLHHRGWHIRANDKAES